MLLKRDSNLQVQNYDGDIPFFLLERERTRGNKKSTHVDDMHKVESVGDMQKVESD
jgi:hypothetical protein